MEVRKKLIKNFLNKKQYSYGPITSLGVLAFCMLMSMLYWNHDLGSYLSANPAQVFQDDQYWRLFTTSFVHGDLSHFLSNSLMLALMGYFVSTYYGLWTFPLLSFALGGAVNYLTLLNHAPHVSLVGASGVVYLLWGFWLINYLLIQRHISLNRRLMKVVAISLAVLVPTSYHANVSYMAHFLGLLVGLLGGATYFIIKRKYIFAQEEYEVEIIETEEEELDPLPTNEELNSSTFRIIH